MTHRDEDLLVALMVAPSDIVRLAIVFDRVAETPLTRLELTAVGRPAAVVGAGAVNGNLHLLRFPVGSGELIAGFTEPWSRRLEARLHDAAEILAEVVAPSLVYGDGNGFVAALLRHERRLQRDPIPTGVLVVQATDSLGRELDDPARKQLAELVRYILRDQDEVYVDGGYIGVIVPGAPVAIVDDIAWRLRIGLATSNIDIEGEQMGVAPSVGQASWPIDGIRLTEAAIKARSRLGADTAR